MKLSSLMYAFLGVLFLAASCSAPKKTEEQQADEPAEAVEETTEETPKPAMYAMTATHSVADFDTWLAGYNSGDSIRSANGLSGGTVHRHMDDSMMVTVSLFTSGHEAARAFVSSPELKAAMEADGVNSEPTIQFWDMQWVRPVSGDSTEFTQVIFGGHEVSDVPSWLELFQSHDSVRVANGVVALGVGTDADNPNYVGMYLAITDMEAATAMMQSEELAQKMQESGVIGEPQFTAMAVAQ